MVLKRQEAYVRIDAQFENDVKMYGTQTDTTASSGYHRFENDVKMYGTQTVLEFSLTLL